MSIVLSVLVKLGDRISAPMRAVSSSVGASVARMQAVMGRVNTTSQSVAKGLGAVASSARGGIAVLAGYNGVLAGLGMKFIGPAAEMERFNVQLTSLEGSSAGAKSAMDWISDFATRTPLEMNQTVEAYAKLKAFGVDPMNGSLQAMVDTMAATGGGAEQLNGLVMALGQSWTKGKLQSEEALQMLERGVPVWDLLAAKMGKSAAEVQELATKGKLGRDEITLLMQALGEKNAGASEGMSKTWDGIISNIKDTWTRFQVMVMDAGVFDNLKAKLQGVLATLNQMAADGRLQKWADAFATNILRAIESIWSFGTRAVEVWKSVYPWLEAGATALGGWGNVIKLIAGGMVISKVVALGGAFLAVGRALKVMGVLAMANPVMAAVVVIAAGAAVIYAKWGAISAWFGRLWAGVKGLFADAVAAITGALARFTPAPIKAAWSILTNYFSTLWAAAKRIFAGFTVFLSGVFSGDMTRVTGGIKQIWEGLKLAVSAAFTALGDALRAVWETIIKPVTDALGATDAIVAGWSTLREGLSGVMDWLGEKFTWLWGVISPVIDGLRWVKDKGAAALSGLGIGGIEGASGEAAPVKGYARGGAFPAGPIVVGENGPELRYESRGGFIAHNRSLRELARLSAVVAGVGGAAAAEPVPVSLGARNTAFNPSYQISLSVGQGHGSPAELEAMLRRVLAEQAQRAQVDLRRRLHD